MWGGFGNSEIVNTHTQNIIMWYTIILISVNDWPTDSTQNNDYNLEPCAHFLFRHNMCEIIIHHNDDDEGWKIAAALINYPSDIVY